MILKADIAKPSFAQYDKLGMRFALRGLQVKIFTLLLMATIPAPAFAQNTNPSVKETMDWVASRMDKNQCRDKTHLSIELQEIGQGKYRYIEDYTNQKFATDFFPSEIEEIEHDDHNKSLIVKFTDEVTKYNTKTGSYGKIRSISIYACSKDLRKRVEKALTHAKSMSKTDSLF